MVEALVGGDRPRKYWNDLKKKLDAEGYTEVSEKIGQLKMIAPDGKQRLTDEWKDRGAATTTKLHRDRDSQGFEPLKNDAKEGGAVAGRTRKDIETRTGKPVISSGNFKQLTGKRPKKLKAGKK